MHDWRHHYRDFPTAVLKWRNVLRIRIMFYVTGQKIRYKKVLPRHWAGLRNQRKKDKAVSFRKWSRKKFSGSLSWQSSETKPRTNLVLVRREPLLYLEFNKPNKQNVSETTFSLCQKNCWHTDWCQEWNIKTSLLKSVKYTSMPISSQCWRATYGERDWELNQTTICYAFVQRRFLFFFSFFNSFILTYFIFAKAKIFPRNGHNRLKSRSAEEWITRFPVRGSPQNADHADCRLQTADHADHADCADRADWVLFFLFLFLHLLLTRICFGSGHIN